jgi:hypothetical protein
MTDNGYCNENAVPKFHGTGERSAMVIPVKKPDFSALWCTILHGKTPGLPPT